MFMASILLRESLVMLASKMKYQRPVSVFLIVSALFLSYSPTASSSAEEVEDEREFDYLKDGKGPQHWGDLKKEWAACKNGEFQSPIDMTHKRVKLIPKSGPELAKMYNPAQAVLKNRGHDLSLQWPKNDAGSVEINGTKYVLQQCHWHSPSEHTINGKSFAMELHMVHVFKDPQGKETLAVVGQLYHYGAPDKFLTTLMSNITRMIKDNNCLESQMGVKDPNSVMARYQGYFRYIGSLTVPPCTEGVIWTIGKKMATVSKEQVHAVREAVHDYAEQNARPVQPLHEREVALYGTQNW